MKNSKLAALRAAFPYTVPIFAGFWFLAMAYGIQMSTSGFSFWYPMIMSAVIYGRKFGICRREHAALPVCARADIFDDAHDSGTPSVLRHFHAG